MHMLIAIFIITLRVFLSIVNHYESLRFTDSMTPHIHFAPRLCMLFVIGDAVCAAFKHYLYFSTSLNSA